MVAAAAPDARSSCALTAVSDHSGLSADRAGVLNAQSWRLIIVWLEVRVLPNAFAIERRFPELPVNDRDVAGLCESGRSQQSIIGASGRFCPHLSLLAKSRFLATETAADGDSSSNGAPDIIHELLKAPPQQ